MFKRWYAAYAYMLEHHPDEPYGIFFVMRSHHTEPAALATEHRRWLNAKYQH